MRDMTKTALDNPAKGITLMNGRRYYYADPEELQAVPGRIIKMFPKHVHFDLDMPGGGWVVLRHDQVFTSHLDALEALDAYKDAKVEEHKKGIRDVGELVIFLLMHPCAPGNDCDWLARRAAIARCQELIDQGAFPADVDLGKAERLTEVLERIK